MAESSGPSNAFYGNPHNDVLTKTPTGEAETESLLAEVRARAKGAFKVKDMHSCDLLYSKAIELCSTDPVLFSNRAMVYLNLGKLHEALADCDAALKLDGGALKAHYRKGQALLRLCKFDAARAAVAAGLAVQDDPALSKLAQQVEEEEAKDAAAKSSLRQEAQDTARAEKPQAPVSLASMHDRQERKKAEAAAKESVGDSMAEPQAQKKTSAADMKGYRKTADGKTTTFFHMDIDDEAKALLEKQGTLPKKLDGPVEAQSDAEKSVWNKAGTWESKNLLKWVQERVKQWVGTQVDLPAGLGQGAVTVTDVSDLTGNAEVVQVRAKRRRVLDVCFHLEWTLALEGGEQASGKLFYDDVAVDDEPEIRVEIDGKSSPAAQPVAVAFVKTSHQGLQPAIAARLAALTAEFATL